MKLNKIKVGRNEPCPCGSGYKYKKCCLHEAHHSTHTDALKPTALKKSEENIRKRLEKQMDKDVILYDSDFEIKMSEVILDLAEDLLKAAKTKTQHQNAIMITCLAWNLAILSDAEKQKEKLNQFLDPIDDLEVKKDTQNIIDALIKMKHLYFPHIDRLILDYELMGEYPNFHLNVASTPPRENLKE